MNKGSNHPVFNIFRCLLRASLAQSGCVVDTWDNFCQVGLIGHLFPLILPHTKTEYHDACLAI